MAARAAEDDDFPRANLYDLLAVERGATSGEIEKSYRDLCRFYHPDKAGAACSGRLEEIKRAYRVLSDPLLRSHYDRYGLRNLKLAAEIAAEVAADTAAETAAETAGGTAAETAAVTTADGCEKLALAVPSGDRARRRFAARVALASRVLADADGAAAAGSRTKLVVALRTPLLHPLLPHRRRAIARQALQLSHALDLSPVHAPWWRLSLFVSGAAVGGRSPSGPPGTGPTLRNGRLQASLTREFEEARAKVTVTTASTSDGSVSGLRHEVAGAKKFGALPGAPEVRLAAGVEAAGSVGGRPAPEPVLAAEVSADVSEAAEAALVANVTPKWSTLSLRYDYSPQRWFSRLLGRADFSPGDSTLGLSLFLLPVRRPWRGTPIRGKPEDMLPPSLEVPAGSSETAAVALHTTVSLASGFQLRCDYAISLRSLDPFLGLRYSLRWSPLTGRLIAVLRVQRLATVLDLPIELSWPLRTGPGPHATPPLGRVAQLWFGALAPLLLLETFRGADTAVRRIARALRVRQLPPPAGPSLDAAATFLADCAALQPLARRQLEQEVAREGLVIKRATQVFGAATKGKLEKEIAIAKPGDRAGTLAAFAPIAEAPPSAPAESPPRVDASAADFAAAVATARAADITVALQSLVRDSKLTVCAGRARQHLPGFLAWEAGPQSVAVQYTYGRQSYSRIFAEENAIILP